MPESPRYRDGEIWFVDGPAVRRWCRDARLQTVAHLPCSMLLGLAFAPDGSLFTNDAAGRKVMRVHPDGSFSVQCDLAAHGRHWTNELSLLPDGGLVVGQIGFDLMAGAVPAPSRLLYVSPRGSVCEVGPELWFANGMVSINDGQSVLVAEHIHGVIWRFDFAAEGCITDHASVANNLGSGLDGIAVAPDGQLAFADIMSGEVALLNEGGRVERRIRTGYRHATSLVFDPAGGAVFVTVLNQLPAPSKAPIASGALLRIVL